MSFSPDQSRFTACVLGEGTPKAQASFDAAQLKDTALREEAVILSRTAHRLANAFKHETPVTLTLQQRHDSLRVGAPACAQARSACTTSPCTSVSR